MSTNTAGLGDLFTAEEEPEYAPRTRKQMVIRYNYLAPVVFIAGVFYTIWAESSHLLAWSALAFAIVTATFLALIVLGIVRDGMLASSGAVIVTFIGCALFYGFRHSVGHLLIPAIVEVVLLALACLTGLHVFRVRR
ncbi:MAG: hypothetical protein ACHQT5_00195 [Candidatus Saccharimonadales bacterium]|jgi:hypothetical protein